MDHFINRVHSLPPELFNIIKDLVFSYDHPRTVRIDEHYKPPKLLQIDKVVRTNLAMTFYSATVVETQHPKLLFRWLATLNKKHRNMITKLQFIVQASMRDRELINEVWRVQHSQGGGFFRTVRNKITAMDMKGLDPFHGIEFKFEYSDEDDDEYDDTVARLTAMINEMNDATK